MSWKIGVDIGGTFIDFCALDTQTNRMSTLKVLTTPDRPGSELRRGLEMLAERDGVLPEQVETFVHGTTVGINTVIQRKGARLALVTNAGFEDVVELGRLRLPDMYSLFCAAPEPLVSRDMIFGISGRVLSDGSILHPLDEEEIRAVARAARAAGAQGVIVSLLHSYRNPEQERAAARIIAGQEPDLFVFAGADVWPVVREYERSTTAILNGYVHPRIAGYLGGLEETLTGLDVPARPYITKSNGGLMTASEGKTACVSMLLSGTASGVMGAAWLARQAGIANVLTLDIGGTSADIAIITDGAPAFGTGEMIGEFPLHIPSVSVSSIGIGGGSIAAVDGQGVLRVGPESAGSSPGPACYGRGGTRPTITDAMAICGYLGHVPMAYGQLQMHVELAHEAMAPLAAALGLSVQQAAQAILDVAVSEMFVEVEKLASREGVDIRDYALMPFGGGGPMLGCFLARELGMTRVIAARSPGVVSALGGLVADIKGDFVRTLFTDCGDEAPPVLRAAMAEMVAESDGWLRLRQGFSGPSDIFLSADMRYSGQSFEIEVALQPGWIETGDMAAIGAAFHRRHAEVYDFSDPEGRIDIVNLRLVRAGRTPPIAMQEAEPRTGAAPAARSIRVFGPGGWQEVPLYLRQSVTAGQTVSGPAVVAQEDTTLVIPEGYAGTVDRLLNIHLTQEVAA